MYPPDGAGYRRFVSAGAHNRCPRQQSCPAWVNRAFVLRSWRNVCFVALAAWAGISSEWHESAFLGQRSRPYGRTALPHGIPRRK